MPKLVDPEAPLGEIKLENVFTTAALKAHPVTRDLVGIAADWNGPITRLQGELEANEVERAEIDAEFKILNVDFDTDCIAFAKVALEAAHGNREDPRFTR